MSLAELKAVFVPAMPDAPKLPDYTKSLTCHKCGRPLGVRGESPAVKVDGVLWHRACRNAYGATQR